MEVLEALVIGIYRKKWKKSDLGLEPKLGFFHINDLGKKLDLSDLRHGDMGST